MTEENKKNILNMTLSAWKNWFASNDEPKFRAEQILEWIYLKDVLDPQKFTNFSLGLRSLLQESFDWSTPTIDSLLLSKDESEKILFKTQNHEYYESVLMPSDGRVTLCISSQIGCKMGCRFCQTGKMGLTRNLTMGEILHQITFGNRRLKERGYDRKITNVVFMGMGEPLDNYDSVVEACKHMINSKMFGLSKHKVTVSTSGLIPEIEKLGADVPVALAISLHSADDALRSEMMPINKKYPLTELRKTLLKYPVQTRHGITFEYVMIKNKNDSIEDAQKLVKFLRGIDAKVNLIPMNAHPGVDMSASEYKSITDFQNFLLSRNISAPIRFSRGQDVSAACGQLASKKQSEIALEPRKIALERRKEYLNNRQQNI